jgi:hypothetical protein
LLTSDPLHAPIPATDFAAIATEYKDSSASFYGRPGSRLHLKHYAYTGDGGFEMLAAFLSPFDTQRNSVCYPATLPDGNAYCMPSTARSFSYDSQRGDLYADAACTDPVVGVGIASGDGCGTSGLDTSVLYAESPFSLGGCFAQRFFHVPPTPLLNPTLYARTSTNACAPYAVDPKMYAFFKRRDCVEVEGSELVQVKVSVVP